MRKFALIVAVALAATVSLSACNKQQDDDQQASQPAATQQAPKPTDPNDTKGWNAYLSDLVQKNLQGMTAGQPFAYLVDAGDSDTAKANNDRQLSNVHDSVARGVLPGNLMAFAGANSGKTADLTVAAFKDAKPGSLKDVIVLFIGDKADEQRVSDTIKPTGATFHFVAM
jgi:ABC-type phosphate/phosphonate transport system substrate-binding protein